MPSSSSSHSVLPSHFTTLIPTTATINYQPEGSMGPQPEPTTAKSQSNGYTKKEKAAVRYGECRKNHAAGIGGYAVDGCREFMASGEEGTPAALRCAACACHRSFHKREVHGEPALLWDCSSNSNFTSSSSSRR